MNKMEPSPSPSPSPPLLARRTRRRLLFAGATGGQLINCLSEYFATRNVITCNQQQQQRRNKQTRRRQYDKMTSSEETGGAWRPRLASNQINMNDHNQGQDSNFNSMRQQVKKMSSSCNVTERSPMKKKQRVGILLRDLWFGPSRWLVMMRLLKLPIVLAALFSFGLALSLITLYTLSFHAHCHNQKYENKLLDENGLTQKSSFVPQRTNETSSHVINSRQLENNDNTTASEIIVQTECASYRATRDGSGLRFSGIAYATPPLNQLRWQRPQPIWRDAKHCNKSHLHDVASWTLNHCVQFSPFNNRVSGQEDCLYLDVYVPGARNQSSSKVPVLIYIHGGFLAYGSNGGEPLEAGDQVNWLRARPSGQLATELNAILVAPNYRLQALGFMTLAGRQQFNGSEGTPTQEEENLSVSGNYGLWDQLVAVNWIRRNINSFGGNPKRLTLFGPDAASALPLALTSRHLGEKESQNEEPVDGIELDPNKLFASVWLSNPSVYFALPEIEQNGHYARLMRSQSVCSKDESASKVDRDNKEAHFKACLMRLPGDQVVREYLGKDAPSFRLDDENSLPLRNIMPDQLISQDNQLVQASFPFTRIKSLKKHSKKLTWLLGSSSQAVEFWTCPRNLEHWSWLDFGRYVSTSLNSFSGNCFARAKQLYWPAIQSNATSPAQVYLTMVSDIRQVCPTNELRQQLLARPSSSEATNNAVVRYIVEWRPSPELALSLHQAQMIDRERAGGQAEATPKQSDTRENGGDQAQEPKQFAFHQWDLLAFFGFQFESSQLQVHRQDLQFQRQVRQLVRQLVWSPAALSDSQVEAENSTNVLVFDQEEKQLKERPEYKKHECNMWREALNQSYAWLS